MSQDITQIREITKEQERVADDLSRLIDHANAPIFGVDTNGLVTEWNRKAANMLGFTKDETMGKDIPSCQRYVLEGKAIIPYSWDS